MQVRAKFKTTAVAKSTTPETDGSYTFNITLSPVTSGSEENESFYKYTPGGSITLNTINETAAGYFAEGSEYYVDFTLAESQVPVPA